MVRGSTRTLVLVATIVLAHAACAPKPPMLKPDSAASDDPEVEKTFREARDLFREGKDGLADEAFARLIDSHPEDPLARVAVIYRARIALRLDNPRRARKLLERVKGDSDPVAERAAFYDGVALSALGEHEEAWAALSPFVGRLTDRDENLLLLDTRWRCARGTSDTIRTAQAVDDYLRASPGEAGRQDALDALGELLGKTKDSKLLRKIAKKLKPDGAVWPLVMSRLSQVYLEAGDLGAAADVLEDIEKKKRGEVESVQKISEMIEQQVEVNLKTLGLIVPLTGRSRLVGEDVLKGVMLAAKERGLSVTIRDSTGLPVRAAVAVRELVTEEHVAAIIGPVVNTAAEAAAEAAEDLRVPLLTLAVKEELGRSKKYVFREFASNRAEVKGLVAAARRDGNSRFGLLYPEGGYGRSMRELYKEALEAEGLELVGEVSYPTDAKEYATQVEALVSADLDALLVPDAAARLALITPALAAAGLWPTRSGDEPAGPGTAIQLLVSSTGLSSDVVRRAGRYMDGAYFATYFHKEASPSSSEFADRFFNEYGGSPDFLSAFAHDCVILIDAALKEGSSSREEIRDWLMNIARNAKDDLSLAAPFDGFSEEGEPRAFPWIMQLLDGELQVVR